MMLLARIILHKSFTSCQHTDCTEVQLPGRVSLPALWRAPQQGPSTGVARVSHAPLSPTSGRGQCDGSSPRLRASHVSSDDWCCGLRFTSPGAESCSCRPECLQQPECARRTDFTAPGRHPNNCRFRLLQVLPPSTGHVHGTSWLGDGHVQYQWSGRGNLPTCYNIQSSCSVLR